MADEVKMAITTAQVLHMVIFHTTYIRYILTAHFNLLSKLRINGATPPFTLYAYMLCTENIFHRLLFITHISDTKLMFTDT
jgi:hypothetical protein